MCLAAFAFGLSEDYPMVFAANRDELHSRPTAAADWWLDYPHILGGRDLLAGGTWLAVDQSGRLAAVTNVPPTEGRTFEKSRGHLVTGFLAAKQSPDAFFSGLGTESEAYGPYNLLIFDGVDFYYHSNRAATQRLLPDIYAVSNAPLGTPWPKVRYAESVLKNTLAAKEPAAGLFEMLENTDVHDAGSDGEILSRRHSQVFVEDEQFGTRASTVILVSRAGEVRFLERRHNPDGTRAGESDHRFKLASADALEATR